MFLGNDWSPFGYIVNGTVRRSDLVRGLVQEEQHPGWKSWYYRCLEDEVSKITHIPAAFLALRNRLNQACVSQRMFWALWRQTTRPEDRAYTLMGLFDIKMSILYGEGLEKTFARLQEEIISNTPDQSIFAWRLPNMTTFRLLANSSDCFQNSGGVMSFNRESMLTSDARNARASFHQTNIGLQITLPLYTAVSQASGRLKESTEARIHCYVKDKDRKS